MSDKISLSIPIEKPIPSNSGPPSYFMRDEYLPPPAKAPNFSSL